jgi:hypothetical protein
MSQAWHPRNEDSQLAEIKEIPAPNPIVDALKAQARAVASDDITQLKADVAALKAKAGIQ